MKPESIRFSDIRFPSMRCACTSNFIYVDRSTCAKQEKSTLFRYIYASSLWQTFTNSRTCWLLMWRGRKFIAYKLLCSLSDGSDRSLSSEVKIVSIHYTKNHPPWPSYDLSGTIKVSQLLRMIPRSYMAFDKYYRIPTRSRT